MRLFGPLVHGQGGETGLEYGKVVIRVDTDAGLYGLGECDDFAGVRDIVRYMKHYFMGRDPFEANAIVGAVMYATLPPHAPTARHGLLAPGLRAIPSSSPTATPTGPVVWAASGVEIALCDLAGKAAKQPVYNLLGGKFRDKVRIYLDRSSPADVGNLDAWRKMGAEAVEAGFRQIKFDIDYTATDVAGGADVWNRSLTTAQLNRIVGRFSAVRTAVGKDFELCADCHRMYNVPDSIRAAQALAPLNLLWLEDPTYGDDFDGYADVRAKSPIPICVGEMFIAEQFKEALVRKAADILHPDILFCGGVREMKRISDLGEMFRLPMAIHGNGGALATVAAAHVAAASRNFLGLEYHFIETPWIGQYVKRVGGAPLFRNGFVEIDAAPGLGIELDQDVCRKHLAAGESLLT
jgi:L-alanine-DL-glutamate epimerase-like enolase superfamily enzyme